DVAERISSKDHEATRLLEFPSARVDIGHAFGPVLCGIEVDLEHARVGTHLDVGFLRSEWDDRKMRTRTRVFAEDDGLLSYGIYQADSSRGAAGYVAKILKGCQSGRTAGGIRAVNQSENCQGARPYRAAGAARPRRRGD